MPRQVAGSIWYKNGSRKESGTGIGVYNNRERVMVDTVFKADCISINLTAGACGERAGPDGTVTICSNCQAVMRAIVAHRITSGLVHMP